MAVFLLSPDHSHDVQYLSNYATIQVRDRLLRLQGIGGINVFGVRDYAMRIWIDPEKAAARNLNASEIVAALRAQNVQVAGGSVGAPPFARGGSGVRTQCPDAGPADDAAAVRRHRHQGGPRTGPLTRVSDVARIEVGAQDYTTNAYVNRDQGHRPRHHPAARDRMRWQPRRTIIKTMEEAKKDFPPGVSYSIPYNPTTYVQQSIDSVQQTLFEAVGARRHRRPRSSSRAGARR